MLNIPIDYKPRGHMMTNEIACAWCWLEPGSNTGNNVNLRLRAYCSW